MTILWAIEQLKGVEWSAVNKTKLEGEGGSGKKVQADGSEFVFEDLVYSFRRFYAFLTFCIFDDGTDDNGGLRPSTKHTVQNTLEEDADKNNIMESFLNQCHSLQILSSKVDWSTNIGEHAGIPEAVHKHRPSNTSAWINVLVKIINPGTNSSFVLACNLEEPWSTKHNQTRVATIK